MSATAYRHLRQRCIAAIDELKLTDSSKPFTLPLMRYILSIPHALPIRHLILGERPYGTDIHPYAASAMSYNPELQTEPTPSVNFLALDISNNTDVKFDTALEWFRDSWKYIKCGVVSLNVCTLGKFMESDAELEVVAMEMFLKDMINISRKISDEKIHVYAMGNPARHSAKRIRSSIPNASGSVVIHECNNPAAFKHKVGDQRSPTFTLKTPRLTKLLSGLIEETVGCSKVVSEHDYFKMSSGQENELGNLVGRSTNMKDVFHDIAAYFKNNTGKTIERNEDLFDRAAQEMKEFVLALQSSKVELMFAKLSEPKNTAKQAFYNTRTPYNKSGYQRGTSTKASSTFGSAQKKKLGFADEDDDTPTSTQPETPATPSRAPSTPMQEPSTPTPMRGSAAKSERSTGSHVGFADDTSDEDVAVNKGKEPTIFEEPPSGNSVLNDAELMDFSYVCDFVSQNEKDYKVDAVTQEFIDNARMSKRAASGPALELLGIIRKMREAGGPDSVSNALGLGDDENPDPISDVVQWILNQKTSS